MAEKGLKLPQIAIAALWVAEGGDPSKAVLASAVAMAESGGHTKAVSYTGCCHGLYQFHHDYFDRECADNPRCATRLAIKQSKNGTDWLSTYWEAYDNGSYQEYMRGSVARDIKRTIRKTGGDPEKLKASFALPGLPDLNPLDPFSPGTGPGPDLKGGVEDVVGGIPDAINDVAQVLKDIGEFFLGAGELLFTPEGWKRIGKLVGGALLLLYGLSIVAKKGFGVGDPVSKVARNLPTNKMAESFAKAGGKS